MGVFPLTWALASNLEQGPKPQNREIKGALKLFATFKSKMPQYLHGDGLDESSGYRQIVHEWG